MGIENRIARNHRVATPLEIQADVIGTVYDITTHHYAIRSRTPDRPTATVFDIIIRKNQVLGLSSFPVRIAPKLDAMHARIDNRVVDDFDMPGKVQADRRTHFSKIAIADDDVIVVIRSQTSAIAI